MLWIKKDTTNILIATLTERSTGPYSLQLASEQDRSVTSINIVDQSDFLDRYNKFTVNDPVDLNLEPGTYVYNFFKQGGTTVLEPGILKVFVDDPVIPTFVPTSDSQPDKVYNG